MFNELSYKALTEKGVSGDKWKRTLSLKHKFHVILMSV